MVNMATQSFIHSELICFVQNNLSNCAGQSLVSSICGFFTVDEITKSKDLLFIVVERFKATLSSQDLPRSKSKLADDGRAKDYANDILSLWEVLYTAKAILPLFGAHETIPAGHSVGFRHVWLDGQRARRPKSYDEVQVPPRYDCATVEEYGSRAARPGWAYG